MKSKEEFKEFGQASLLPELQRLEQRRKQLLIKIALLTLAVLILAPLARSGYGVPIIYLPGLITFIFLIFACDELFRKYPAKFKNTITRRILTFIDPSLTYSAGGGIPIQDFRKSNLFEDHIERYSSIDLVQGRIGKTEIKLSFIKADRSKDNNESEIFQGLFIIIDMNKEFQGQTLVYPNTAEQLMGPVGKVFNSLVLKKGERIELENSDFNDTFVIYSSHAIEARYILTPGLMERILEVKHYFRRCPCFSFTHPKVYIAVERVHNTMNPKIFSSITDFDSCYQYFDELQRIVGIVDDLNLNTRIWSKE